MNQGPSGLSFRQKCVLALVCWSALVAAVLQWISFSHQQDLIALAMKASQPAVQAELQARYDTLFWHSLGWDLAIVLLTTAVGVALAASLVRPLEGLRNGLARAVNGDLTRDVTVRSQDEIGQMAQHFNRMLHVINRLLTSIRECSVHMGQSANQIAAVAHEIERISAAEAVRSEEVNEATGYLHQISEEVMAVASRTREEAQLSEKSTAEGIRLMQEVMEQMNGMTGEIRRAATQVSALQGSVETINAALANITGIADQTNLLALNAAIEAARAGEQGRGFAVVADEVRSLSVRTAASAQEVSNIIAQLNRNVSESSVVMSGLVADVQGNQQKTERARVLLSDLETHVSGFVGQSGDIYNSIARQLNQFSALETTLACLFETLRENGTKIGNTSNISETLASLTRRLDNEISGIQFEAVKEDKAAAGGAERRDMPRLEGTLLVTLYQGEDVAEGLSQDISMSGINILVKHRYEQGDTLELDIRSPNKDFQSYAGSPSMRIKARVMWRKAEGESRYRYGMRFLDPSSQAHTYIQRCCDFYDKVA